MQNEPSLYETNHIDVLHDLPQPKPRNLVSTHTEESLLMLFNIIQRHLHATSANTQATPAGATGGEYASAEWTGAEKGSWSRHLV